MKYEVLLPFAVWQKIEVEADSEEDAIETASLRCGLSVLAGYKAVGASEGTLEVCDDILDVENIEPYAFAAE